MPITSREIAEDSARPNGTRRIRFEYTDHTGRVWFQRYIKAAGYDADAGLIAGEARQLIVTEKFELGEVAQRVRDGENPLTLVNNPVYSTSKKVAKVLIRAMMANPDPLIILLMEPLVEDMKANFTNAQLANFLDVTIDQLARINTRYNAIIAEKALLEADAGRVEELP